MADKKIKIEKCIRAFFANTFTLTLLYCHLEILHPRKNSVHVFIGNVDVIAPALEKMERLGRLPVVADVAKVIVSFSQYFASNDARYLAHFADARDETSKVCCVITVDSSVHHIYITVPIIEAVYQWDEISSKLRQNEEAQITAIGRHDELCNHAHGRKLVGVDGDSLNIVYKNVEKLLISDNRRCSQCNKECRLRCDGCKVIFYCSTTCQREHWRHHKESCASLFGYYQFTAAMYALAPIMHRNEVPLSESTVLNAIGE